MTYGTWPPDHGHSSRSAKRLLAAQAQAGQWGDRRRGFKPEGHHLEGQGGGSGSGAGSFARRERGLEVLNGESWHRVGRWHARGISEVGTVAEARWLSEGQVDAVGDTVRRLLLEPTEPLPAAWAQARAGFVPTPRSNHVDAHRPLVPSDLSQGWVSWPIFMGHEADAFRAIQRHVS